ncbi:MAG: tetratricopeptide repeat protein [Candidatus Krumholzibacteriota bacterium]|nr:tetratricopeptide repeat protein [Candidatus Krumholzibacteriota bacterium]
MNIQNIILIILAGAAVILFWLLILQKKRKRRTVRSKYIDALYALIEGRRDDALALFTQAVRNGENDVDAYIQLGNLLREKNQPEKALQIHKALTVRKDLGYEEEKAIQMGLAEDLSALGKLERAIKALEAVHNKKRDPDIIFSLHKLYHRQADYDNALAMLKEVSRFNPEIGGKQRAAYLSTVAYIYRDKGDNDNAKRYLDKALKEDPASSPALYMAGELAMKNNDLKTASRMWERLLKTDISLFGEILPLLEKALYDSGMFGEMEKILEDLLERYPENASILVALASLFVKKGELKKGISLLEERRRDAREVPSLTINLASMHLQAGEPDRARKILEGYGSERKEHHAWDCGICGKDSDSPLSYCFGCSNFNTYHRKS